METIRSPREIDSLFRDGRRGRRSRVSVLCAQTPGSGLDPGPGRVVFVAGKRLGPAVLRNRCKRVMRESLRRIGGEWPGRDVALIATGLTAGARPGALDADLTAALRDAGAVQ